MPARVPFLRSADEDWTSPMASVSRSKGRPGCCHEEGACRRSKNAGRLADLLPAACCWVLDADGQAGGQAASPCRCLWICVCGVHESVKCTRLDFLAVYKSCPPEANRMQLNVDSGAAGCKPSSFGAAALNAG